jgi:hypothetical protein
MGSALAAASDAVMCSGPVDRVYVQLFNEVVPGHVHFHVVPRFAQDTERGADLGDSAAVAEGFDVEHALRLAAGHMPARRIEPSALVRAVRWGCDRWARWASLYRVSPRLSALDRAETYVLMWIIAWAISVVLGWFVAGWVAFGIVGIAWLYRVTDMALYEVGILLDTSPTYLVSVPRALLLRVLNIGEAFLATSALLMLAPGQPSGLPALLQGFAVAALQPNFGQPGIAQDAVLATSWVAVLVVLTGGVAMLVGKIGETFSDSPN